jgi:zinc protease
MMLAGALCFVCSGGVALAQDSFPTRPPADLPARPVTLPRPQSRTLPNGLKVVVLESRRVPLVTMRLLTKGGAVMDPADSPGLASAVASQLTGGTSRYSSRQLAERAESLGGSVGASASEDFATVSASGLAQNANALIELLAHVVREPAFPAEELDLYRNQTLQGLVLQRQNPDFLAQEQFNKALYGTHPYGIMSTTPEAVRALSRDRLRAFHAAHYVPDQSVLIVVGDVKASAIFDAARRQFAEWKGPAAPAAPAFAAPSAPARRTVYLVNRPGSVQSNIVMGNLAIKRNDPDYFPLLVTHAILGGAPNNRIYNNVREQKGFAYDARTNLAPSALAGDLSEQAQTRTDVTAAAIQEMFREAERIRTEPVSEQELAEAKAYLAGVFVIQLQQQTGMADRLQQIEVFGLPANMLNTFRDQVRAVTAADVKRVAEKYLRPDHFAVVVVGDAEKLRDSLRPLGELVEAR